VPLLDIAEDLDALPLTAKNEKLETGSWKLARIATPKSHLPTASSHFLTSNSYLPAPSSHRIFPPAHAIVADTNQILLAVADFQKEPGVILDYNTINNDYPDFDFQPGTYYISGGCNLSGTTIFEGGAVIKFSSALDGGTYGYDPTAGWGNGVLNLDQVNCLANIDIPVIFTSSDDNSVGDVIEGSSGSPATLGITFLNETASYWDNSVTFKGLRFNYANVAVVESGFNAPVFMDCEFLNCNLGFGGYGGVLTAKNCLFAGGSGIQDPEFGDSFVLENVTMANAGNNLDVPEVDYGYLPDWALGLGVTSINILNSLFNGVQSISGLESLLTGLGGTVNDTANADVGSGDFVTAANANYYLAANSQYRDVGTTAIDADLLADLQTTTTYAPQDGGHPDNDGLPDLGYHFSVNEDSDYAGIPGWWIWKYFGNLSENGTSLDAIGNTLLYDYQKAIDPNIIEFSLQFPSYNVNTSPVQGTLAILNGTPAYMAVMVNDMNPADAVWQPYQPNVIAALNSGDGIYTISVGLRGLPPDATQTWMQRQIVLNTQGPKFIITSPAGPTVAVPLIQLQGLVSVPLSALTYDVSNALSVVNNQTGYWNPVFYDTNALAFTTNAFQCYDISLTNGLNLITLHATDTAGNTTTTNISYTLDYASDTTPPVLSVVWPPDGTTICGSNFTLQAQVDDNTATVTAAIVDINGNTSTVAGLVDRGGAVWVNNLPLAAGANALTLTATDAAGNSSTTSLTVYPSSVTVTLDPLTQFNQSSVTVMGAISDPSYDISVNGVAAYYLDGLGDWEADGVPANPIGTGVFDVEVSSGTGAAISAQKSSTLRAGNATPNPATVVQQFPYAQPATVSLMSYTKHVHADSTLTGYCLSGPVHNVGSQTVNWLYQSGGGFSSAGSGRDGDCNPFNSSVAYILAGGFNSYTPAWECNDIIESEDWNYANYYSNSGYSKTETQTRVMILPAGMAVAGQTALYLVQAQVWDEDNGLQLAASAVRFLNQLAGTTTEDVTYNDGSVWSQALVSAPAGAQVEVTPKASGNVSFTGMKIAKDKIYWQNKVQQDSGVVNYLASRGFMDNRQNIQAVYAFYQKLFVQNQNFLWAGLAKLAGAPVYAGLSDAENLKGSGFYIGGLPWSPTALALGTFGETYGTTFQNDLISMNIAIYSDLAWQFEAYKNGGLAAIQTAYAYGNSDLDQPATNAWGEIDQGIQESDSGLVQDGNQKLLQREQQQILASGYLLLSDLPGATTLMTKLAKNPVPNGPDFLTVVPSGNIADYDNRWTWITDSGDGMWPLWVGTDATTQKAWVITSLKNRAVGYSLAQTFSFLSLPIQ